MQKFNVIRPHIGDKVYGVGDVREADPQEVAGLIGRVLEPIEAEAEPQKPKRGRSKKAASGAPENKAED